MQMVCLLLSLLSVITASVLVLGMASMANATTTEIKINSAHDSAHFEIWYHNLIFLEYVENSDVADLLRDDKWIIRVTAPEGSVDSEVITYQINQKLQTNGNQARVSDIRVTSEVHFEGDPRLAAIEHPTNHEGDPPLAYVQYITTIWGEIGGYTISEGLAQNPALLDMEWRRSIFIDEPVFVEGVEINMLMSALMTKNPDFAAMIAASSEAKDIFGATMMGAGRILDRPLDTWEYDLYAPGLPGTVSWSDLDRVIGFRTYNYQAAEATPPRLPPWLDTGIAVSQYNMFESIPSTVIKITNEHDAILSTDETFVVRTHPSSYRVMMYVLGFAQPDTLDGIEIFHVLPNPPEEYDKILGGSAYLDVRPESESVSQEEHGSTLTGRSHTVIAYYMFSMVAIGATGFFIYRAWSVKRSNLRTGGEDMTLSAGLARSGPDSQNT